MPTESAPPSAPPAPLSLWNYISTSLPPGIVIPAAAVTSLSAGRILGVPLRNHLGEIIAATIAGFLSLSLLRLAFDARRDSPLTADKTTVQTATWIMAAVLIAFTQFWGNGSGVAATGVLAWAGILALAPLRRVPALLLGTVSLFLTAWLIDGSLLSELPLNTPALWTHAVFSVLSGLLVAATAGLALSSESDSPLFHRKLIAVSALSYATYIAFLLSLNLSGHAPTTVLAGLLLTIGFSVLVLLHGLFRSSKTEQWLALSALILFLILHSLFVIG